MSISGRDKNTGDHNGVTGIYRDKIYYLTEKKIIIYIKTITTIPEGANSYFKLKVGSNSIRGLRVAIMNKRVCVGLMNG